MTVHEERPREIFDSPRIVFGWLLIAALVLSAGIGSYPLIEPDEGRNAEVAREMAAGNDYVLPRLNGLPYLDKPVVFFAAAAFAIELFGPTEFAARLAPFLFGLAVVLLVGWFAHRTYGPDAAAAAAAATLSAPLMVGLSHAVIMDTALCFFVVLALISFHEAVGHRVRELECRAASTPRVWWTLLAWCAMALGVLTKGPVALAVPLLVAAPYALWRRSSRAVWHPLGPLLLLALVVPWVWAVTKEIPNFLEYVVVTETWSRMTSDELRRTEPFWFFVPVLLAGTFPWWMMVVSNRRRRGERPRAIADRTRVYLWLWLLAPLVLFSLSRGKQEQYVLPLVPAVALLAAGSWPENRRGVRLAGASWAAFGFALIGLSVVGFQGLGSGRVSPDLVIRTAVMAGAAAAVGGLTAWFSAARNRTLALVGLSVPLVVISLVAAPLLRSVAADRSSRGLAGVLRPHLESGADLMWVGSYAGGLSFYLQRTVPLATSDGAELRSNYILNNHERFLRSSVWLLPLDAAEIAAHDCRKKTIFLVRATDDDVAELMMATRVPLSTGGRRWSAYGPSCVPAILPP